MLYLTILVFILILGILILAHEFGHFLVARKSGVKILEFAFGFPPKIFSWKRGQIQYSINAIPIGGYVRMLGEENESQSPGSFSKKSVLSRFLIVISGVFFNFLLAVLLLSLGFSLGMTPLVSKSESFKGEKISNVLVAEVSKGSPAENVGLKQGDLILGFKNIEDFQNFTKTHKGQEISLAVKKNKKVENVKVTLSLSEEAPLGVGIVELVKVKLPFFQAIWAGLLETFKITWLILKFLGLFFKQLFVTGKVAEEVTGPVGIFTFVSSALKLGFIYLVQLTALISVNLALINLIPFPALDGGRLLFLTLEGVKGKKIIRAEIENIIHLIGFIILILLVLALTYRDIARFILQ